jgi:hypothetical protein
VKPDSLIAYIKDGATVSVMNHPNSLNNSTTNRRPSSTASSQSSHHNNESCDQVGLNEEARSSNPDSLNRPASSGARSIPDDGDLMASSTSNGQKRAGPSAGPKHSENKLKRKSTAGSQNSDLVDFNNRKQAIKQSNNTNNFMFENSSINKYGLLASLNSGTGNKTIINPHLLGMASSRFVCFLIYK